MRLSAIFTTLLASVAATAFRRGPVAPGSLTQVTSSSFNATTAAGFYIYVPNNLAASPGVIVAVHYCTGTAQLYYTGSPYAQLAEQYGFIVIYPSSPHEGRCWDVSSRSTLTHEGGGDSNTIANMVKWTVSNYPVDTSKVFVTGTSSGAMMTNVLAATYPEMFHAGIVYAGVPAGCFYSNSNGINAWNNTCSQGQSIATPQQWANIVYDMYPGYQGARPKMQIYHGSIDDALLPPNYNETIKQWSSVLGYDYSLPASVTPNDPQASYSRTVYGPNLQGIYALGVGHNIPIRGTDDMKWFGFA